MASRRGAAAAADRTGICAAGSRATSAASAMPARRPCPAPRRRALRFPPSCRHTIRIVSIESALTGASRPAAEPRKKAAGALEVGLVAGAMHLQQMPLLVARLEVHQAEMHDRDDEHRRCRHDHRRAQHQQHLQGVDRVPDAGEQPSVISALFCVSLTAIRQSLPMRPSISPSMQGTLPRTTAATQRSAAIRGNVATRNSGGAQQGALRSRQRQPGQNNPENDQRAPAPATSFAPAPAREQGRRAAGSSVARERPWRRQRTSRPRWSRSGRVRECRCCRVANVSPCCASIEPASRSTAEFTASAP